MHPADREIWTAIDRGNRDIDWEAWFGHPDGADYLTEEGKAVARRAAADLTAFFGKSWLHRAVSPSSGRTVRGLGGASPVFSLSAERRSGAYVEAIRWWASLQLAVAMQTEGIEAVRRDARNDVSIHRLAHTLAQARLAAIGAHLGAQAILEPVKVGGPGDVLLRTRDLEIFLEIVTFGPDEAGTQDDHHFHRHFEYLIAQLGRHEMHWAGDIPGFLNRADEQAWQRAVVEARDTCIRISEPVEITGPWGRFTVRPGATPGGTQLAGPELATDSSARLAKILDRKAAQTRGAGLAWIWVEDHGGVHPLTPFVGMPLSAKIRALTGPACSVAIETHVTSGSAKRLKHWRVIGRA